MQPETVRAAAITIASNSLSVTEVPGDFGMSVIPFQRQLTAAIPGTLSDLSSTHGPFISCV